MSNSSIFEWAKRLRSGLRSEIRNLESDPSTTPKARDSVRHRLEQVERLVASFPEEESEADSDGAPPKPPQGQERQAAD